jgi:hypothetical protein
MGNLVLAVGSSVLFPFVSPCAIETKSNGEFPHLPILGAENPMQSCLSAVLVSSHLELPN